MLRETLYQFFQQYGLDRTYWIGYSGGVDSHVLLHACQLVRQTLPIKLRAVHVNHHISSHSNDWAQHVENICLNLSVDCTVIDIALQDGKNLEEQARDKRYAALAACLLPHDMLLTAHQQDDQAETVLLQLIRGAGPKGLAAMPVVKAFSQGWHGRPLLNCRRAELASYAHEHHLTWIEDESNTNPALARNYIRHQVMPLLAARWPAVSGTISRAAAHCAEAQVILDDYALSLLNKVSGVTQHALSVRQVLVLNAAEQRLVLRAWIQWRGFKLPDAKTCTAVLTEVLLADQDRMPCLAWSGAEIRRYRDELFIMPPLEPHDKRLILPFDLSKVLVLPGIGSLSLVKSVGVGLQPDLQHVVVRFRQGGETLLLPGRGRHTLKHLFQEWGVPPWERDRLPLLFVGDRCIAVLGYAMDEEFTAKADEVGLLPVLSSSRAHEVCVATQLGL